MPTIDLSHPIPGGSLHGNPRPPLENTGDDYAAITKSLIANLRWISENPDPRLVADVYLPGTPGHDLRVPAYEFLVANGYRWADEGYRLIAVDLISAQDGIASVRIVEDIAYERLLDRAGQQVGERRQPEHEKQVNLLLARGADGRWRIAGGAPGEAEVEL